MPPTQPTLAVLPTGPLEAGGSAQVTIQGGIPNSTAVVTVENGKGQSDTFEIELDEDGNGTGNWDVPSSGWELAKFNSDGCEEVVRLIDVPEIASGAGS